MGRNHEIVTADISRLYFPCPCCPGLVKRYHHFQLMEGETEAWRNCIIVKMIKPVSGEPGPKPRLFGIKALTLNQQLYSLPSTKPSQDSVFSHKVLVSLLSDHMPIKFIRQ